MGGIAGNPTGVLRSITDSEVVSQTGAYVLF